MQAKSPKHCGIVSLLVAQALFLAFPRVVSAQSPPPISAEAQTHILREPGAPLLGSAGADVTVVEYFDYNCPFCKALAPAFHPFIDQDHAAANFQGKYLQAHDALMSAPRLAENKQVDAALRGAGIDMVQLKKDLATHRASIDGLLMRNEAEARGLGLRGTPGVLVGRRVVSGISDLETLQSAVAISRRAADR